ncbi:MAG: V-type ATPase 116kDa subunit family protein [Candidatus Heimdallarchaeaceae archaeon]
MAKRILSKIQTPKEHTLSLLSTLYHLSYFEQIVVDSQSPSELARIEDQKNLFLDFRSRLLYMVRELEISSDELLESEEEDYPQVIDLEKVQNSIQDFLGEYEESIISLCKRHLTLDKKHLIADKLYLFKAEFQNSKIPIELLAPGPSTFSAIGDIHKSYEDIILFYLRELTKDQFFFWSTPSVEDDYKLIFILTLKEFQKEIETLLEENYFDPLDFDLSLFADILSSEEQKSKTTIDLLHDTLHDEHEEVKNTISEYRKELRERISSHISRVNLILRLLKLEEKSRTKEDTFTIWGWVDEKIYPIFEQDLKNLPFKVKVKELKDVPLKYKKSKEEKEEIVDLTYQEEKEKEKHVPPYSFLGESKGGALFPKEVDFIKIEAPKEHSRELISYIRSLQVLHQEKIGKQSDQIEEKLKKQKLQLTQYLTKVRRLKELLDFDVIDVDGGERFNLIDKYEESVKFIEEFLDKYAEKIETIATELKELKTDKEHLKLYLPFEGYLRDEKGTSVLLDEGFQTCMFIGTLPKKNVKALEFFLKEITDNRLMFWKSESDDKKDDTTSILVLSLKDYEDSIQRVFDEYSFQPVKLNKTVLKEGSIKDTLLNMEKELEEKIFAFEEIKEEVRDRLVVIEELIEVELERIETEENCKTDAKTITMWGWIPKEKIVELKEKLDKLPFPVTLSERVKVPLTNPSLTPEGGQAFKAVRGIVNGMGVPSTHEVDPYKIVRFTFPIIFGIMFADLGHGILLMLIGLFLSYKKRKNKIEPDESMSGYLYGGSELLAISGFSAAIFGMLFGALLGDEMFLPNIYENIGLHWLPLLEPTKEVPLFLIFSLTIGFIIMQIGLWFRFVENKKYGHNKAAWIAPIILSIFYVGLFVILYNLMGAGATSRLLNDEPLPPIGKPYSTIFLIIVAVTIPAIFIIEYLHEGSEGIMEAIDYILSLFSNTLSFSRILAMLLVHAILSGLPFILAGVDTHHVSALATSWIYWVIGLAWGLLVIVPVEGLFSFLQTLRLHWVEFFSKFYKGEGIPFQPLTEQLNYIDFIPAEG